jgi:hypothetical protein
MAGENSPANSVPVRTEGAEYAPFVEHVPPTAKINNRRGAAGSGFAFRPERAVRRTSDEGVISGNDLLTIAKQVA